MDFLKTFQPEITVRSGLIGGVIVFMLLILARNMHICTLHFPMRLGMLFTRREDEGTEMIGCLVHLAFSILLGFGYALAFHHLRHADMLRGLMLAVPHLALTLSVRMVARKVFGRSKFLQPAKIPAPAYRFQAYYNLLIITMLHLVFGASMGALLKLG